MASAERVVEVRTDDPVTSPVALLVESWPETARVDLGGTDVIVRERPR